MHVDTDGGQHNRSIVMLHGWAMHGGILKDFSDTLVDAGWHTLRVDLPGHGHSDWDSNLSLADLAADVVNATSEHLERPAVWLGWSLGGLVALQAALTQRCRNRGQVSGMVLVAANPCFVSRNDWPHGVATAALAQFARELGKDLRATILRFLALEVHGSLQATEQLRQLSARIDSRGLPEPAALRAGLEWLRATDLRNQLSGLHCPSLWIGGRRDRLVPPPALELCAEQAGGQSHIIPGAGHAPFLQHAQAMTTMINQHFG